MCSVRTVDQLIQGRKILVCVSIIKVVANAPIQLHGPVAINRVILLLLRDGLDRECDVVKDVIVDGVHKAAMSIIVDGVVAPRGLFGLAFNTLWCTGKVGRRM